MPSATALSADDLRSQLRADPRQASRTVLDTIRDLEHQASMLEAQLRRIKPPEPTLGIWQRRLAVLDRRRRELASMLPVRADPCSVPASADLAEAGLSSTRRRVVAAVQTLMKLKRDGLPEQMAATVPAYVQAAMGGCDKKIISRPSPEQIEDMWRIIVGLSVAISDEVARHVVWMRGSGLTLAEIAVALDLPRRRVAELEATALWALSTWLARHGH